MKMMLRTSEGNVGQTYDSLHSSSHIQPRRLDQVPESQKTYLPLGRGEFLLFIPLSSSHPHSPLATD